MSAVRTKPSLQQIWKSVSKDLIRSFSGHMMRQMFVGSCIMKNFAKLCFAGVLAAVWPTIIWAQSDGIAAISKEFSSLLIPRNETTEVAIEQCTLTIEKRVRTSCTYATEPNWTFTTIDLREINGLQLRPFREGFALSVEFDVPKPSRLRTALILQLQGEKAARDFYFAELDRLLNESELMSNKTFVSCTGEKSEQPRSRSMILFFDDKPTTWQSFEALVQNCN